jgi:hypothetical protein
VIAGREQDMKSRGVLRAPPTRAPTVARTGERWSGPEGSGPMCNDTLKRTRADEPRHTRP